MLDRPTIALCSTASRYFSVFVWKSARSDDPECGVYKCSALILAESVGLWIVGFEKWSGMPWFLMRALKRVHYAEEVARSAFRTECKLRVGIASLILKPTYASIQTHILRFFYLSGSFLPDQNAHSRFLYIHKYVLSQPKRLPCSAFVRFWCRCEMIGFILPSDSKPYEIRRLAMNTPFMSPLNLASLLCLDRVCFPFSLYSMNCDLSLTLCRLG
jgi:hypothetical protein